MLIEHLPSSVVEIVVTAIDTVVSIREKKNQGHGESEAPSINPILIVGIRTIVLLS
jgi:hypothetical protein